MLVQVLFKVIVLLQKVIINLKFGELLEELLNLLIEVAMVVIQLVLFI